MEDIEKQIAELKARYDGRLDMRTVLLLSGKHNHWPGSPDFTNHAYNPTSPDYSLVSGNRVQKNYEFPPAKPQSAVEYVMSNLTSFQSYNSKLPPLDAIKKVIRSIMDAQLEQEVRGGVLFTGDNYQPAIMFGKGPDPRLMGYFALNGMRPDSARIKMLMPFFGCLREGENRPYELAFPLRDPSGKSNALLFSTRNEVGGTSITTIPVTPESSKIYDDRSEMWYTTPLTPQAPDGSPAEVHVFESAIDAAAWFAQSDFDNSSRPYRLVSTEGKITVNQAKAMRAAWPTEKLAIHQNWDVNEFRNISPILRKQPASLNTTLHFPVQEYHVIQREQALTENEELFGALKDYVRSIKDLEDPLSGDMSKLPQDYIVVDKSLNRSINAAKLENDMFFMDYLYGCNLLLDEESRREEAYEAAQFEKLKSEWESKWTREFGSNGIAIDVEGDQVAIIYEPGLQSFRVQGHGLTQVDYYMDPHKNLQSLYDALTELALSDQLSEDDSREQKGGLGR